MNTDSYKGWNTSFHTDTFGFWNELSNTTFNFMYGNFQENRFLLDLIKKQRASNILDVGCATGTTYRLLLNKIGRGKFQYYGIDMSEPAVEKAKSLYTKDIFCLV